MPDRKPEEGRTNSDKPFQRELPGMESGETLPFPESNQPVEKELPWYLKTNRPVGSSRIDLSLPRGDRDD